MQSQFVEFEWPPAIFRGALKSLPTTSIFADSAHIENADNDFRTHNKLFQIQVEFFFSGGDFIVNI